MEEGHRLLALPGQIPFLCLSSQKQSWVLRGWGRRGWSGRRMGQAAALTALTVGGGWLESGPAQWARWLSPQLSLSSPEIRAAWGLRAAGFHISPAEYASGVISTLPPAGWLLDGTEPS